MPALPDIGESLPDVVLRTAVVYLFLVTVLRISGKREVGQMSVLELVVIALGMRGGAGTLVHGGTSPD